MVDVSRRRMIRRYTSQPVADEAVHALLQAAISAPSPHNRQPWRFAVIRGDALTHLADAMGRRLREDLLRDGLPADAIERDMARSRARICGAPVSVLACLCMADMDRYADAERTANERWMAGQAVACAIQNMLLHAPALGLGACWMCAPLFCQETVRAALRLSADWEPQALVTIGYPADSGRERPRMPVEAVTEWRNSG